MGRAGVPGTAQRAQEHSRASHGTARWLSRQDSAGCPLCHAMRPCTPRAGRGEPWHQGGCTPPTRASPPPITSLKPHLQQLGPPAPAPLTAWRCSEQRLQRRAVREQGGKQPGTSTVTPAAPPTELPPARCHRAQRLNHREQGRRRDKGGGVRGLTAHVGGAMPPRSCHCPLPPPVPAAPRPPPRLWWCCLREEGARGEGRGPEERAEGQARAPRTSPRGTGTYRGES